MPNWARVAVVVPVLNEAVAAPALLRSLAGIRAQGATIVLVDGGSTDGTVAACAGLADEIIGCAPGRARQLRAGIAAIPYSADRWIWLLHADTLLADGTISQLAAVVSAGPGWGRFDVKLDDPAWPFRMIESLMNWRSRLTGIATGDQGIFVRCDVLTAAGGIPALPLMEDIALSRQLKLQSRPICLAGPVTTSARRWRKHGIVRTMLLMWRLRLEYFFGADPAALHLRYYGRAPGGTGGSPERD